jgi:hypothetical protein
MERISNNKTFLIYAAAFLMILSACKKEDKPAFDKSPDERINATLSQYQSLISGAQYGWKAVVHPAGGGAYSFYFKFNNANRVVMYSDFDSTTAVTPRESSYRLKALQQPSLIFDTYSYLHLLSDPNETAVVQSNINGKRGGRLGVGLQSDFEYAIDSTTADRIFLVGRQHGTKAYLVKATQQEAAAYENRQLATALLQLQNLNKILFYFKRLTLGSRQYDVSINDNLKTIAFTWVDASGVVRTFNTTYYYTVNGIEFSTPFVDGTQSITGFTGISWNGAAGTFTVSANNSTGTITGVNSPIAVDRQAAGRWYNTAASSGSFWISENGFHANGVDDAFGIKNLTSGNTRYFFLVYWPMFGSNYDLMAPVFLDPATNSLALLYGTASRPPTMTTDGRAIFREFGTLGTGHPTTGPAAQSRTQLYNASGYYFVQTSPSSYDMVSAADARIWITWEL